MASLNALGPTAKCYCQSEQDPEDIKLKALKYSVPRGIPSGYHGAAEHTLGFAAATMAGTCRQSSTKMATGLRACLIKFQAGSACAYSTNLSALLPHVYIFYIHT